MARNRLRDPLQSYPFWLVDVTPSENPPFFALNPLLGFSTVSAPEISVENQPYRPMNSMYQKHIPSAATVGQITLRRAARATDTDFYRWITRYIDGTDTGRRNLVLIQFHGKGVAFSGEITPAISGADISAPFAGVARVPGRAWVLWGVVPVRYNAGNMDAKSGEVVLMDLTIQPERVTETALGVIA